MKGNEAIAICIFLKLKSCCFVWFVFGLVYSLAGLLFTGASKAAAVGDLTKCVMCVSVSALSSSLLKLVISLKRHFFVFAFPHFFLAS